MSFYRQQLESFLSELDVKANTVLDIGGAQGNVRGRTKSWDVKEYEVLDLPDFDIETDEEPNRADIIFCLEVFEYLIRPLEALYNIHATLKKGGRAYVTFAFSYPHHNELELDALRYTEPGIRRMAKEVGLEVVNIWYRWDKSGLLKSFYSTDGMRMAKEYPNHDVTGFICELRRK